MSGERPLHTPEQQVFEHSSPALHLVERFLRDAKKAYERGGWNVLSQFLARAFKTMTTDGLTGLFTRDALFLLLERIVLPRMKRVVLKEGETYGCLVLLDLDHFKRVNTSYGHAGGDMVLQGFGRLVQEQFREYDVIGRVGGDEFIVVVDGLPKEEVEKRMVALRDAFREEPWKLELLDDELPEITMSFSHKVIEIDDPDKLLERIREADKVLMRIKRERDKKNKQ